MDIAYFLKISMLANGVLLLLCIGLCAGAFLSGVSVGRKLSSGVPLNIFGGTAAGDVFQAGDKGGPDQAGDDRKDPLAFLDGHIARAVDSMGQKSAKKTLLDPDLAGETPDQARTGGF